MWWYRKRNGSSKERRFGSLSKTIKESSAREHPLPEKSPKAPPSSSKQPQEGGSSHLKTLIPWRPSANTNEALSPQPPISANTNNKSTNRSTATKEESPKFDAAKDSRQFLSKWPQNPITKKRFSFLALRDTSRVMGADKLRKRVVPRKDSFWNASRRHS